MIKKISIFILLIFYILFFGEMFFRALDPQPILPRYVTDGGDGIRANLPNSVYSQVTPEVDVEIRINSQGIRSDEFIPYEKGHDEVRIVLLGDSFFMGYEVDIKDSMAMLLENKLALNGINAKIINLAVSGFGTAEHLIALTSRAKQFKPDIVIMQWHASDPDDNIRSNLFKISNGSIEQANKSYLPGIRTRDMLMKIPGYKWLIGNSHLYTAIREKAALMVKSILLAKNKTVKDPHDENVSSKPEIQLSLALFEQIERETKSMGANLIILDVPIKKTRTEFISSFSLLPKKTLEKYNVFSPIKTFEEHASPIVKLYYEQGHGHWSVKGNKLVTDYLSEELIKHNFIEN